VDALQAARPYGAATLYSSTTLALDPNPANSNGIFRMRRESLDLDEVFERVLIDHWCAEKHS